MTWCPFFSYNKEIRRKEHQRKSKGRSVKGSRRKRVTEEEHWMDWRLLQTTGDEYGGPPTKIGEVPNKKHFERESVPSLVETFGGNFPLCSSVKTDGESDHFFSNQPSQSMYSLKLITPSRFLSSSFTASCARSIVIFPRPSSCVRD